VENNPRAIEKARGYAFLLLKFRQRSKKEISERLRKKRFDEQIIKETITFLENKGFVDDKIFARAWIESRIKKPFGIRKIRQELNFKGIDKEIIDSEINVIKKKYPEEEIIEEVAKIRLGRLKGIDPNSVKRRLYSYLLRRGFSPEIVTDIVTRLCKHTY